MFEYRYGLKSEAAFIVEKSPDLLAVRTHAQSTHRLPVSVDDGQVVMNIVEAGVCVYRIALDADTLKARKSRLRSHPDVRFAGAVLVERETGEPVLYSENIFIKFIDSMSPQACLLRIQAAKLTIKRPLSYSTNAYFVSAAQGCGTRLFQMATDLLQSPDVEFCHPELLRQRSVKAIDARQWHLKKTIVEGLEIDASANVDVAHLVTQGEGIVIAVIDDGFDIDHQEFSGVGKIVAPRNFDPGEDIDDPRPTHAKQSHGTCVAGVACANGQHAASGVAPRAQLMPIKCNAPLGSLAEADAFMWAAEHGADVINCSWSSADGAWFNADDPLHQRVSRLPASTRLAIEYALTHGRKGKGCVVLFAAGNGNESADNDGYVNNPQVIAVAACNDTGGRSSYSDYGQAVWCSFPSSDVTLRIPGRAAAKTKGIWTTDRLGAAGKDQTTKVGDGVGDYTATFGGTSSACPGAAGVAALMLAVNPALTAVEVKNLMAHCCQKIHGKYDRGERSQYDAQGHSEFYGYGRLDAQLAVHNALNFKPRKS